jgi:hypothetical protein
VNGTDTEGAKRPIANDGKGVATRKKSTPTRVSQATRIKSPKKSLHVCGRHGYHSDATANKKAQEHGWTMHKRLTHGKTKRQNKHVEASARATRIPKTREDEIQKLIRGWLTEASNSSSSSVANAYVNCISGLNRVMGRK